MNSEESRRSQRHADFLPIYVSVNKTDDGSEIAGPFSARIVDVSNHGACLLLTQVMMQAFHIFHSTREDEHAELVLHIAPPTGSERIDIMAQPVWLNSTKIDDLKVFKMGVDFLETIDNDLLHTINLIIKDT